jgi:hypothetical protein
MVSIRLLAKMNHRLLSSFPAFYVFSFFQTFKDGTRFIPVSAANLP